MRIRKQSSAAAEQCRADANRQNAQHSTGPRTAEGKNRSCQNSFKHGLYSKQLIRPDEDPAEFDELRATLRREHEPVNTTEEILVDELAQHFWRLRRFREMEARAWGSDDVTAYLTSGYLTLVTRNLASAERSFFRTLAALTKLQKVRGFVPQKQPAPVAAAPHRIAFFDDEDGLFTTEICLHELATASFPKKPRIHPFLPTSPETFTVARPHTPLP